MRWILVCVFLVATMAPALASQDPTGTLQQIKATGKIKVGYRESLPPLSFLDKQGEPTGYSVDLCRRIVSAVERTLGQDVVVEYVPVTSADRFVALAENKVDLLCGGTTRTIARGERVDFTLMTFVTGASFMTLQETHIRNNFEGKKIGVSKGTTTLKSLSQLLEDAGTQAEIVPMASSAEALKALDKGAIDAIAADQVVLMGLALTSGQPSRYKVLPDLFSYEPFALAVRRNDADFRLVADGVIADLYRSKKILAIYNKWFGAFSSRRSSAFDAMIQINAIPE